MGKDMVPFQFNNDEAFIILLNELELMTSEYLGKELPYTHFELDGSLLPPGQALS